jgi:hypothetical protein
MKSQTFRLTRELLALYLRYGPEEFEAASRELREGKLGQLVADTADNVGNAAKQLGPGIKRLRTPARAAQPRPSKRESLTAYLERLKAAGTEADVVIAHFAERIVRQEILDSAAAMRDFMRLIGIRSPVKSTDKYQNIRQVVEFLRGLPPPEAREKISVAEHLRAHSSSLQGWADIIVKTNKN